MTEYTVIDIDKIEHITNSAVLVKIDEDEQWIPLSVLDHDSIALIESPHWGYVRGLEVAVWFAEKEGLV